MSIVHLSILLILYWSISAFGEIEYSSGWARIHGSAGPGPLWLKYSTFCRDWYWWLRDMLRWKSVANHFSIVLHVQEVFYIGTYYMKWVKPSRTYSIWILSFYRDLSCYFERQVQMSPIMTRKIVLSLLCSSLRQTMVLGYSSVR